MSILDLNSKLGAIVARRRRLLGLTQGQLAARIGVSHQTVQKYECGATMLSAARLWEIAHALGVSITHFFETADLNEADNSKFDTDEIEELLTTFARLPAGPRHHLMRLILAD